jgi:hypothetical protein
MGRHRGMNRTYEAIEEKYSWTHMKQEIEDYLKKCEKCQLNKLLRLKKKAPLEVTTTARKTIREVCSGHSGHVDRKFVEK